MNSLGFIRSAALAVVASVAFSSLAFASPSCESENISGPNYTTDPERGADCTAECSGVSGFLPPSCDNSWAFTEYNADGSYTTTFCDITDKGVTVSGSKNYWPFGPAGIGVTCDCKKLRNCEAIKSTTSGKA